MKVVVITNNELKEELLAQGMADTVRWPGRQQRSAEGCRWIY